MRKQILAIALGLFLTSAGLGLTACSGSGQPIDTTPTDTRIQETVIESDVVEDVTAHVPEESEEQTLADVTETTAQDTWSETSADTIAFVETQTEAATELETLPEEETVNMEEIKEDIGLDVKKSDLQGIMRYLFDSQSVTNETVMFMEKGDAKALLYPIDNIISVTSYDGSIVYQEGVDYVLEDGNIRVTENSSIPCITANVYYNWDSNMLITEYNGKECNTFWGELQPPKWQVCVTYTHQSAWEGYMQECELDVYAKLVEKLQKGRDVTIFFYGDSITQGANASYTSAPYQPPYTILFAQALADLFDYTVEYVHINLRADNGQSVLSLPQESYVGGDGSGGTIRYVNTAIGGWTSKNGLDNISAFVLNKMELYGCDLFVVGFGMNDITTPVETTKANIKGIVDAVLAERPRVNVMLISTMVPNPDANAQWYGNQEKQEVALQALAREYRASGVSCAVACMTSVSKAVLERKDFRDYTGNNINHPNDFFIRIYAQTLLQTLIGYENMD